MKKFIHQARHQSGMVRLTVVCTLLIVLTLVALTLGHKKFSSSAYALPVSHGTLAARGCGCSALDAQDSAALDVEDSAAQPPPLVGYWSPPVKSFSREEIAALPTVLLLKAGASLPLNALIWDKKLGPKAKWAAANGAVDAAGEYTAPPYTPSRGDDILTLSDPSNIFINAQIHVHILPNPAIPGSAGTPYIKYTPAGTTTGPDSHVYYSHKLILPSGMNSIPAQFLKNIVAVFNPQDMPAPSSPVTDIAPDKTAVVSGQAFYPIPAQDSFGQSLSGLALPASSVPMPLMTAKELPLYAGTPQTNPAPAP